MKCLLTIALLAAAPAARAGYDPLAVATPAPEPKDFTVRDEARSRDIPVRVYLPADPSAAPVVLFSHGLGGSREGSAFLGKHWAGRGYAAVFLQHPGSDDGVWKTRPGGAMAAMKAAASAENLQLRIKDVPAVLDRLTTWNKDAKHPLAGRLDAARVGMSGHSFGAVTTQAVSGQHFPLGKTFTDPRVKAAVVMSPSGPRAGDPAKAFGGVKLPWLLLTGTKDDSPLTGADPASRLVVFPALPAGDKYELVLNKAEHSAFTERPLPGDKEKRNPNHHKAILATTTAFWDAYLKDDADAKAWLADDKAVRGALETADRWQRK